ncbi:hypothetical protein KIPB_008491, partial [Kipferlia bialata]
AFVMLSKTISSVISEGYYKPPMQELVRDQHVLEELIRIKLPQLYRYGRRIYVEWGAVTTEWFLCMFGRTLTGECLLRTWDWIFAEGNKVIFRTALGLMQMHQTQLLKAEDILELSQVLIDGAKAIYDPDELADIVFNGIGSFSSTTVSQLRESYASIKY